MFSTNAEMKFVNVYSEGLRSGESSNKTESTGLLRIEQRGHNPGPNILNVLFMVEFYF